MKKDAKKTDFYLSKIKEKLQQITDRAYHSYVKKLDTFKAEYGE